MKAKIINNVVIKYPYTLSDLKKDHPNISFPDVRTPEMEAAYDVFTIIDATRPSYDFATQNKPVRGLLPEKIDGQEGWYILWDVQDKNQEELDAYQASVVYAAAINEVNLSLPTLARSLTTVDNITDLPDIKAFLRKLVKAVYVLVKKSGV